MIAFTWTKFDAYYVSGWDNSNMARPMTYKTSLKILKDSAQLAKFSKNVYAEMFKEYVLAEIYYKNNDTSVALCHYNNVKTLGLTVKDEYPLGGYVLSRIKQIRK